MADRTALQVLESIDARLGRLEKLMAVEKLAAGVEPQNSDVADDRDLDGKFGDEVVRFDPRDWSGDSFKGSHFSECPADFLSMLAEAYDYFAEKNAGTLTDKGKPKSDFDRRSARRARGWAKRIRAGYKPAAQPATEGWAQPAMPGEDEVPF